jgi:uncharacterized protein YccT (UPF0319 family)
MYILTFYFLQQKNKKKLSLQLQKTMKDTTLKKTSFRKIKEKYNKKKIIQAINKKCSFYTSKLINYLFEKNRKRKSSISGSNMAPSQLKTFYKSRVQSQKNKKTIFFKANFFTLVKKSSMPISR